LINAKGMYYACRQSIGKVDFMLPLHVLEKKYSPDDFYFSVSETEIISMIRQSSQNAKFQEEVKRTLSVFSEIFEVKKVCETIGNETRILQNTTCKQSEMLNNKVDALAEKQLNFQGAIINEIEKLNKSIGVFDQKHFQSELKVQQIGAYLAKHQDLAESPWLNYIPAPFSWYAFLHKLRSLKKPDWFSLAEKNPPKQGKGKCVNDGMTAKCGEIRNDTSS